MSSHRSQSILVVLLVWALAACSGSTSAPATPGSGAEGAQSVPETATSVAPSSATSLAVVGVSDLDTAIAAPPCEKSKEEQPSGTLTGSIVRRAYRPFQEDGIGTVQLLVLDVEPAASGVREDNTICNVAKARYLDVDLSVPENAYEYKLQGVPARAEPYFVMVIFDDNNSLPKSGALRLDKGDLLSTLGDDLSFPSVVVPEPSEVLLDLSLDFLYDFSPVGVHRFQGNWVLVPKAGAKAAPDSGAEAGLASLEIDGVQIRITVDGVQEDLSYSFVDTAKHTVLTTTDSKGASKSVVVTWNDEGVMEWSKDGKSGSEDALSWRRR